MSYIRSRPTALVWLAALVTLIAVAGATEASRAAAAPGSAQGELYFLGIGDEIPAAILRAGVQPPVLGAVTSSTGLSQCSSYTGGDIFRCSTRGMAGTAFECTVKASQAGNPDFWGCSARCVVGGANVAWCSAANTGALGPTFCSVMAGSQNMACSTNKDAGGGGHANCSAYGGGQGTSCSVENGSTTSSTCSSYGGSSDNSEHCSAGSGSDSNSKCSVVEGSGNTCTANNGSATNCSTTQGASGTCSSYADDGNGGFGAQQDVNLQTCG